MTSHVQQMKKCPMCSNMVEDLLPIDTAMRVALEATKQAPPAGVAIVCASCYEELSSRVSQGVRLRIEQEGREKNKMMLWKGRVALIKQARSLMQQKAYSEAAVSYEKYLRTLEMVYNLKSGDLSPAVFNNSKRSKELTVITSVYWDLVRIYDLSPRYQERMVKSAQKLAQFLPFSPIFPDIVRKADSYSRQAKNPQVIRNVLRSVKAGGPRCYVATVCFAGDAQAPEVLILRNFRDRVLKSSSPGRSLVWLYYRTSPTIAHILERTPLARRTVAYFLRKMALHINKGLNFSHRS